MNENNPEPMGREDACAYARATFEKMESDGWYYQECVDEATRVALESELAEFLLHGYLNSAAYECRKGGQDIWTATCQVQDREQPSPSLVRRLPHPGKAEETSFSSRLAYSKKWHELSQEARGAFQSKVGIVRDASGRA